MFQFLKYLPLLAQLKDARAAIEAETGKKAPVYWSRKVVGPVLALAGGFAAIQFGVNIDQPILDQISGSVEVLGSVALTVYGAIMGLLSAIKSIVGLFRAKGGGNVQS